MHAAGKTFEETVETIEHRLPPTAVHAIHEVQDSMKRNMEQITHTIVDMPDAASEMAGRIVGRENYHCVPHKPRPGQGAHKELGATIIEQGLLHSYEDKHAHDVHTQGLQQHGGLPGAGTPAQARQAGVPVKAAALPPASAQQAGRPQQIGGKPTTQGGQGLDESTKA
jgi:hypothetical protein